MINKLRLLSGFLVLSLLFVCGCDGNNKAAPTSATSSFSSSFNRDKVEDRNVYATFPSSVVYFPVQMDSFTSSTYPDALARGQLVLEGGSFRLKPALFFGFGKSELLIWPPGFSARTISGATYVISKNGDTVAYVGDIIEVGGGEVPAEIVEKYTGQSLSADRRAPYWLVSTYISDKTSLDMNLPHAKPYEILYEGNVANDNKDRSAGIWFITSGEASSYEERAQTAILAVSNLRRACGRIFTSVSLVAGDDVRIDYAQASYASDGKGALGMTGSVQAHEAYWTVRAANRQLTEREYAIAKIWNEKELDFPSTDMFSSSSYDVAALQKYVADTMGIPIEDRFFIILEK